MNQQTYRILPRELKHLSNIGLDDIEIDYLMRLKRKRDISKKWKH